MLRKRFLLLAFASFLVSACGDSGGSVHVMEERSLNGTPKKTWEKIGAFNDMSWHPAVERTEMSEDGSKRTLFLKGGGEILEKLIDYQDGASYKYEILEGPLPVENYVSTLYIKPDDDGGTIIVWESDFDPIQGVSEDDAAEAIRGVYRGGLDNLR